MFADQARLDLDRARTRIIREYRARYRQGGEPSC